MNTMKFTDGEKSFNVGTKVFVLNKKEVTEMTVKVSDPHYLVVTDGADSLCFRLNTGEFIPRKSTRSGSFKIYSNHPFRRHLDIPESLGEENFTGPVAEIIATLQGLLNIHGKDLVFSRDYSSDSFWVDLSRPETDVELHERLDFEAEKEAKLLSQKQDEKEKLEAVEKLKSAYDKDARRLQYEALKKEFGD